MAAWYTLCTLLQEHGTDFSQDVHWKRSCPRGIQARRHVDSRRPFLSQASIPRFSIDNNQANIFVSVWKITVYHLPRSSVPTPHMFTLDCKAVVQCLLATTFINIRYHVPVKWPLKKLKEKQSIIYFKKKQSIIPSGRHHLAFWALFHFL